MCTITAFRSSADVLGRLHSNLQVLCYNNKKYTVCSLHWSWHIEIGVTITKLGFKGKCAVLMTRAFLTKMIAVSLHEVCLWGRLVWSGSNSRQDCHRLGYKDKVSGVVVRWQELGESMFAESKFCRWIGKQICWSDESLIRFVGRFSSMWSFTRSWRCGEVGRQIQESRDLDLLRELTQIWVLPW